MNSVHIIYRPLKIGWCVRDDDVEALIQSMKLTNVFWGGFYNPIIPVDNKSIARKLVREFRVDILYSVKRDPIIDAFINEFNYLKNPFLPEDIFLDITYRSNAQKNSQILTVYHPIRQIYESDFKNVEKPKYYPHLYTWDNNDPLALMLLATIGQYPDISICGVDYEELLSSLIPIKNKLKKTTSVPTNI